VSILGLLTLHQIVLQMVVQELPANSTVRDLVSTKMLDVDSLLVNASSSSWEEPTVKVNHQLVDNLEQKLKMGDFVEVLKIPGSIITESSPVYLSAEERIAIEFQREQLKRLYLEGGNHTKELRTASAGLARELVAENNVYLEMRY
jgi:GTP pyrophosphokinase